jgi:hypothetical protein
MTSCPSARRMSRPFLLAAALYGGLGFLPHVRWCAPRGDRTRLVGVCLAHGLGEPRQGAPVRPAPRRPRTQQPERRTRSDGSVSQTSQRAENRGRIRLRQHPPVRSGRTTLRLSPQADAMRWKRHAHRRPSPTSQGTLPVALLPPRHAQGPGHRVVDAGVLVVAGESTEARSLGR